MKKLCKLKRSFNAHYYCLIHRFTLLGRKVIVKVQFMNKKRKKVRKLRSSPKRSQIESKSKYMNLIRRKENLSV